ncbi:MAG: hypothetical protein F7B11_02650 [Caldisphaeraceae archaeon]|nr:hypothetical protein [Caldisphaeraceae archaeon]
MISIMVIISAYCFQFMVSIGNIVYISQAFGAGGLDSNPSGPPQGF